MTESPVVAYLSLGSNLGDRLENLRQGLRLLCENGITLCRTSSVYETEPVDYKEQDWFLNCVAEISTTLEPLTLLRRLRRVETELGRQRAIPKGPRTLDMDILLFGDSVLQTDELTIPHPRMLQRRFVLEPLREIAATHQIPNTGKTVDEAFRDLRDPAKVRLSGETLRA